jgi:hypothetical protein
MQREVDSNSKTTCFTFIEMPSNTVKDACYNSKTSCFTFKEAYDTLE